MVIPIFVGLLFVVIGIGILIFSVVSIWNKHRQLANSLSANGFVSEFATEMGRSGHLYYPVVQFEIPSGKTIRFRSSLGSSRTGYSVGQQVKVLYDAHNPQQAEIDTLAALWLLPGCMLAMGLVSQ